MKYLRHLWQRLGLYVEAAWAFFHPIKILEAEIEANKMFGRIKASELERRIAALEKAK